MLKATHLTLLLAALGLSACTFNRIVREYPPNTNYEQSPVAGNSYTYYAESMPPEQILETVPPQPHPGWVWIEGFWHWNGTEWVWIPGYWSPPMAGMVYIYPYYDWYGDTCIYVVGHWDWPGNLPAGTHVDRPGGHRPPGVRIPHYRDHRVGRRDPVGPHPGRGRHDSVPLRGNERVPAHRGAPAQGPRGSRSAFEPAYTAPSRRFAPPSATPPRSSSSPASRPSYGHAPTPSRGSYAPPTQSSGSSHSYGGSRSTPSRSYSSPSRSSSSHSSPSRSYSSPSRSSSSHSSSSRSYSSPSRSSSSHSSSSHSSSSHSSSSHSSSSHSSGGSHSRSHKR